MELAMQNEESMFDSVLLSLTRRDIALIDICLGIAAHDYTKGPNLRSEIESLRIKLKSFLSLQDIPRRKQAECEEEAECGCRVKNRRDMEKTKDPICGMLVDPETTIAKSEYMGKIYYFCTAACKKVFDTKPDKYASPLSMGLEGRSH